MINSSKRHMTKYVNMKMDGRVENVSELELERFFNEKGWHLFELDKMIESFRKWRQKNCAKHSNFTESNLVYK